MGALLRIGKRRRLPVQPLIRPNVLLVLSDDQDIASITPEAMPYLHSRPHGSWVDFPRAVVTTPLCGISRATLFSGQQWQRHGVNGHSGTAMEQFDETKTLATALTAAGYRTGLFGKYNNQFPWSRAEYVPPGWESFFGETGDDSNYYNWHYVTNIPGAPTDGASSPTDYIVDVLRDLTVDFIEAAATDPRPWFAMVTPVAPHTAGGTSLAVPANRHASATITVTDPPDWNQANLTGYPAHMQARPLMTSAEENSTRAARRSVGRSLLAVDEMLAAQFAALEATGQLDNTVVIYLTDNSNGNGRKRSGDVSLYQKRVPYYYSSNAMLRVRYPGADQRSDPALVASVDLPTSITEWAGATPARTLEGSPRLADWCLGTGRAKRPSVVFTYPKYPSSSPVPAWDAVLTDAGQKFVRYPGTGETERFDTAADPYEMTPLQGASPSTDTALAALLDQHLANPRFWEG